MTTLEQPSPTASIDPATQIGLVGLTVADLARSLRFYTGALGLAVLRQTEREAVLGAGDRPLLLLAERPALLPWMIDAATGLYHYAILLPARADLGRFLRHYFAQDYPPPGQGDHVVSEALYLRDPDGHGIEVYWDRPRETWTVVDGQVRMASDPVDVRGLLAEAESGGRSWEGMPAGATLGHIHLQVGDIERARDFYHGLVGFDIMAQIPEALFVSAGGYHHHLGMNTWHSRGAAPAPADTASLQFFTLTLPSDAARAAVLSQVAGAGGAVREEGGVAAIDDPWGNVILLHVGQIRDADAAAGLLRARSSPPA